MPTSTALWKRRSVSSGADSNNLYQIIGVPENAPFRQIRTAYRKKALQYHPDKRRKLPLTLLIRAEAIWQKLSSAYETLSNKERRQRYDMQLARERRPSSQRGRGNTRDRSGNGSPSWRHRTGAGEVCSPLDTSFVELYEKQTQRQARRLAIQQKRDIRSRQRIERFGQRLKQQQQQWTKKLDSDLQNWASLSANLVNTDEIKATFQIHISAFEHRAK